MPGRRELARDRHGEARRMDQAGERAAGEDVSPAPSSEAAELSRLASSAFEVAARLVGARASQLYTADRATAQLRLVAHRGVGTELLRTLERVPLDVESPEALAFARRTPQVSELGAATTCPRVSSLLRRTGAQEYVVVPLVRDDQCFGVFTVAVNRATGPTTSEIVEIASALAMGLASAQALERERRRRGRLESLRSAAITIAAAPDLDAALQTTVEVARSLTGARFGALGVVDEQDPTGPFRPWVFSGMGNDVACAIGRTPRPVGLLGAVIREGRPIRVGHVALDPRYRGVPRGHPPVRSFIGVPILSGGRSVGNLFLGEKVGAPEFDADDEEALVLLAEHAGAALRLFGDVARLTQRASAGERAQRHLAAHYAVAGILAETASFADAAARILCALCESLGWVWGCLWRVDPPGEALRFAQLWQAPGLLLPSFTEMTRRISFPTSVGLPGRVWHSGEPIWVRDVVDEPRFLRLALAAKEGMHGAVFFPIRTREQIVGVIEIMSTRVEAPDEQLMAMLVGVGAHLGQLLERQRVDEEREILLGALAAERSWLRALFERSPVGTVFVSDRPETFLANRRAEQILGPMSSRADLVAVGSRLRRPDGEPLEPARLLWNRALAGEVVNAEELSYVAEAGSGVDLLASAAPITNASGERIGAVALFEDISSMRELAKLREEWTAMVAHDLRQPVTAITAAAGLLARGETSAESRQRAERILGSAGRLDRMISDLLDASRLDARRLALATERIEPERVIEAAIEHAASTTEGHAVRVETTGALPRLDIDPGRIEQVLVNLLSNAAKYGMPGSPIVVQVEAQGDETWISVVNEGRGLSKDEVARVFGRFERLDGGARSERAPGIGLGLHIAKGLVEAHGGRMWVESEPGRTTRFRFALPVPSEERTDRSQPAPRSEEPRATAAHS